MSNTPLDQCDFYTAAEIVERERGYAAGEWFPREAVEEREALHAAELELLHKAYRDCDADRLRFRSTSMMYETANQKLQEERDALLKATLNLTSCLARGR